MKRKIDPAILAWLILAASTTAAFSLSCRLSAMTASPVELSTGPSVIGNLLSSSQVAFGGYFQEQADEVFHGGVNERHREAFTNHLFQVLEDRVSPKHHIHLDGARVAQTAPWLWISLQADPHNMQSYLVAAHWLASPAGLNQPERALELLDQGIAANPRSYRLHLESGLIKLRAGRIDDATMALNAGLHVWPDKDDPNSESAQLARETLLTYRALISEARDDVAGAMGYWRQVLQLFPNRTDVRDRMSSLAKGDPLPVKASMLWKKLLSENDRQRSECHRSDDHDDGDSAEHADHVH